MFELLNRIATGDFILLLSIFLLGIVLLLRLKKPKWRKKPTDHSMLGYSLLYADQKGQGEKEADFGKLLYAEKYDLQGKPDYIYRNRFTGSIVPMEIKSGFIKAGVAPHQGDLLQLVTYFLIVEEVYGVRPPFGKLVYQDYMFVIPNTKSLKKELLLTLQEMRTMLKTGKGEPSPSFAHCRHCLCRGTVCDFEE